MKKLESIMVTRKADWVITNEKNGETYHGITLIYHQMKALGNPNDAFYGVKEEKAAFVDLEVGRSCLKDVELPALADLTLDYDFKRSKVVIVNAEFK